MRAASARSSGSLHGGIEGSPQQRDAGGRHAGRREERSPHLVGGQPTRPGSALSSAVLARSKTEGTSGSSGFLSSANWTRSRIFLSLSQSALSETSVSPGDAATPVDLAALHRDVALRRRLVAAHEP